MARGGVGTATSEFFIVIGDQPGLDYGEPRNADMQGFAAFGQVVSGMDVVRKIQGLPADGPTDSDYTKRPDPGGAGDHFYDPSRGIRKWGQSRGSDPIFLIRSTCVNDRRT